MSEDHDTSVRQGGSSLNPSVDPWEGEYRRYNYGRNPRLQLAHEARQTLTKFGLKSNDKNRAKSLKSIFQPAQPSPDSTSLQDSHARASTEEKTYEACLLLAKSKLHPTVSFLDQMQMKAFEEANKELHSIGLRMLAPHAFQQTLRNTHRSPFDPPRIVQLDQSSYRSQQRRIKSKSRNQNRQQHENTASQMTSEIDVEREEEKAGMYLDRLEAAALEQTSETQEDVKPDGYKMEALLPDPDSDVDLLPRCFEPQNTESVTSHNGTALSVRWRTTGRQKGQRENTGFAVGCVPILSTACPSRIPVETLAVAYLTRTSNVDNEGVPTLTHGDREYVETALGLNDPSKWWSDFETAETTVNEKTLFEHLTKQVELDLQSGRDDDESLDVRDDLAMFSYGLCQRALEHTLKTDEPGRISLLSPDHTLMAVVDMRAYGNDNDFAPPTTISATEAIESVMRNSCYRDLLTANSELSTELLAIKDPGAIDENVPKSQEEDRDSAYCSASPDSMCESCLKCHAGKADMLSGPITPTGTGFGYFANPSRVLGGTGDQFEGDSLGRSDDLII